MRLSHNLKLLMVASFLQGSAIKPINGGSQVANTSELKPITQEIQSDQDFWKRAQHWDRTCSKYLVAQTNKVNGRVVLFEDAHGIIFENTRHGKILFNLELSGHTDIVEHYAIYFAEKLKKHSHYYKNLRTPAHKAEIHHSFIEFVRGYQDKMDQTQLVKMLIEHTGASRPEQTPRTVDSAQVATLVLEKLEAKKQQDELARTQLQLQQMKELLQETQRNASTKKRKPKTPQSDMYDEYYDLDQALSEANESVDEIQDVEAPVEGFSTRVLELSDIEKDMEIIRARKKKQKGGNSLATSLISSSAKPATQPSVSNVSTVPTMLPTTSREPASAAMPPVIAPLHELASHQPIATPAESLHGLGAAPVYHSHADFQAPHVGHVPGSAPHYASALPVVLPTAQPLHQAALDSLPVDRPLQSNMDIGSMPMQTPSNFSSDIRKVRATDGYKRLTLDQDRTTLAEARKRSAEAVRQGRYLGRPTVATLNGDSAPVVVNFVSPSNLLTPASTD